MKLRNNISAILRIKNEEYWISYVIEALGRAGFHIYVGDTGSTDATADIVRSYLHWYPQLHFYDFSGVPVERYGKIWEWLSQQAETPWVMAIGDEIFTREGLEIVLDTDIGDYLGAFFDVQNITWDHGFRLSSQWTKRKVYRSDAVWVRTILQENVKGTEEKDRWLHIAPGVPLAYHMRYIKRSSRDGDAYGRERKYLCHGEPLIGEPIDFFDVVGEPKFPNYYWNMVCRTKLELLWNFYCKDPEHMEWLTKWRENNKDKV